MPLVLPRQRKRNTDGRFAAQLNVIKNRRRYFDDNKHCDFISRLRCKINLKQYSDIVSLMPKLYKAEAQTPSDATMAVRKFQPFSSEWVNWINQQYINIIPKKSDNTAQSTTTAADTKQNIFIGLHTSFIKTNPNENVKTLFNTFKYKLIFNVNTDMSDYNVEMICLNILLCSDFKMYKIFINKDIMFHEFIDYIKETNNVLFLKYIQVAEATEIYIV